MFFDIQLQLSLIFFIDYKFFEKFLLLPPQIFKFERWFFKIFLSRKFCFPISCKIFAFVAKLLLHKFTFVRKSDIITHRIERNYSFWVCYFRLKVFCSTWFSFVQCTLLFQFLGAFSGWSNHVDFPCKHLGFFIRSNNTLLKRSTKAALRWSSVEKSSKKNLRKIFRLFYLKS